MYDLVWLVHDWVHGFQLNKVMKIDWGWLGHPLFLDRPIHCDRTDLRTIYQIKHVLKEHGKLWRNRRIVCLIMVDVWSGSSILNHILPRSDVGQTQTAAMIQMYGWWFACSNHSTDLGKYSTWFGAPTPELLQSSIPILLVVYSFVWLVV